MSKWLKNNVLPMGWVKISLREILTLEYGKSLIALDRENGFYKVWGSNGIVGTHNNFLVEGPVIIVGRKGSVGTVNYSAENCWPIDTTYYINSIKSLSPQFVFYLLQHLNLPGFSNRQEINAKYLALNLKSKNKCFLLMFNRADLTVGGGKKLSGPTS